LARSADERAGTLELGRHRQRGHVPGVEQPVEERDVGIPPVLRRMRAEPLRREERAVEMRTDDLRPAVRRWHLAQRVEQHLLRRGDERRLVRGYSEREKRLARAPVVVTARRQEVDAGEAVHLQRDEARHGNAAPACRGQADADDAPVIDLDVAGKQLAAHERGFDAEPQTCSGRPLASERLAASDTLSAQSACSPVPCSGCRSCSRHETKYSISGPHGSALSTSSTYMSPSAGWTRSPRADDDSPMFPSPSTGAAENAYSATPRSPSTRTSLENGYDRGIAMLPSAKPEPPSAYSTTACT